MDDGRFPIYRRLSNGNSFYRITSDRSFDEVQRIGDRCVLHVIDAATYPERLRIAEMIDLSLPGVGPSEAREFDHWAGRC